MAEMLTKLTHSWNSVYAVLAVFKLHGLQGMNRRHNGDREDLQFQLKKKQEGSANFDKEMTKKRKTGFNL